MHARKNECMHEWMVEWMNYERIQTCMKNKKKNNERNEWKNIWMIEWLNNQNLNERMKE